MTTSPQNNPQYAAQTPPQTESHPFAGATVLLAGSLLLIASVLAIFEGIAALVGDDSLVVLTNDYIYRLNLTTWGWIHLLLGIIGVIIAIGMFTAKTWARVCAIIIASLSIIANFLWLPYTPWWALLVIGIDILVIWAAATWNGA